MVLANEMRGSSSVYSQCNSRETRLQGSSANMSYYSVVGTLHCCNNCRFNRLFHPSHLQTLSPSEQLSAAIYFFYPNRFLVGVYFFTLTKFNSSTMTTQAHSSLYGWVPKFILSPVHHHKVKSTGNKIQDQIQTPFYANLQLGPQI